MHISCPRCDKTINAKDFNLFQIWECPDCEWRFRGVHAGQPSALNFLYEFIAPIYHGPHINDISDCPYCGTIIDLNWMYSETPPRKFGPFRSKGYNGPYVCRACCRSLPWDYPEQKPHVLEAYRKWAYEHNKKYGFDNSQFKDLESKESKKENQSSSLFTEEQKDRLSKLAAEMFRKKHNS